MEEKNEYPQGCGFCGLYAMKTKKSIVNHGSFQPLGELTHVFTTQQKIARNS
jgi:hypothetical protein